MSKAALQNLHLQWHVTQRCNLRCKHCYQDSYDKKDLSFNTLINIAEQYKDALDYFSNKTGNKVHGHITITGGEPFAREDFLELLDFFSINKYHYSFSVLTNGTLIDEVVAKELKRLKPTYVQVSIEGTKETHEHIRGKGSYDKAVNALKYLNAQNIPTLISFTAHKKNYHEFYDVAKLGYELGVSRVWSDRLIPCGNGKGLEEMLFTPEDTKEFFELMQKTKEHIESLPDNKTEIAMHRALQHLCGGKDYQCSAAKTFMTIDYNGDVYPCRRMPIVAGNINKEKLINIYQNSTIFKDLREPKPIDLTCQSCEKYSNCGGGLKCLSYAITGNANAKDPGCWLL